MPKLHVLVLERDKMTLEIVNRDEIIAARIQRAKDEADAREAATGVKEPVNPAPYAAGTPHTFEFNWNAAYALQEQEGGSANDIPDILVEEVANAVAPEYDPADVDVEVLPKKE